MAPLPLFFGYALFLQFFLSFFTSWSILSFAPFLVIVCYHTSLEKSLWWAFFCGILLDLFSYHLKIGTYALLNCLSVLFVYRLQIYFFMDRLSTLPLMTAFFSILFSCFHLAVLYFNGYSFQLSLFWLKTHVIEPACLDAFYAGICFTPPFLLFSKPSKRASPLINLRARS